MNRVLTNSKQGESYGVAAGFGVWALAGLTLEVRRFKSGLERATNMKCLKALGKDSNV